MVNYIIGTRCSTEEQAKGLTSENQMNSIIGSPITQGWACLGIFQDAESGTTFNRKKFKELELFAKKNKKRLNYILFLRWDRFARNVEEALRVIRIFREIGIEVNCIEQWIDFRNPESSFMLNTFLTFAEVESKKNSIRTKDGINATIRAGFWVAGAPLGYEKSEKIFEVDSRGRKRKIPFPNEKAEIVKFIDKEYLSEKYSISEIRELVIEKYSLKIGRTTIAQILKNIFYTGRIEAKAYKEFPHEIIIGKHQAIRSMQDHKDIQGILAGKAKRLLGKSTKQSEEFFLKGSLRCQCGAQINAYTNNKHRKNPTSYYDHISCKDKKMAIPKSKAEAIVQDCLNDLQVPSKYQEELLVRVKEKTKQNREKFIRQKEDSQININKLEDSIKRYRSLLASRDLTAKEFREGKKQFDNEIQLERLNILNVEAYIRSHEHIQSKLAKLIMNVGDVYEQANVDDKRLFLSAIFPEGFYIDKLKAKVRTPKINEILLTILEKEAVFPYLVDVQGTEKPLWGRKPFKIRTILANNQSYFQYQLNLIKELIVQCA